MTTLSAAEQDRIERHAWRAAEDIVKVMERDLSHGERMPSGTVRMLAEAIKEGAMQVVAAATTGAV